MQEPEPTRGQQQPLPKKTSVADDTQPGLPAIQAPAPQATQYFAYTQHMPPPPPNTQVNYKISPPSSGQAPYDYNRPYQPQTPMVHDYERARTTTQFPVQATTPLQQYKDYVKFRINYSSKQAARLRLLHNILQITILAGAAIVSVTVGFPEVPKWIPALVSGIVTLATAMTSYYKFGERSRDLYKSAEDMQQEYNWFKSKRGPYKNLDETQAFELLQDKVDVIKREQFQRSFAFEEQKDTQK